MKETPQLNASSAKGGSSGNNTTVPSHQGSNSLRESNVVRIHSRLRARQEEDKLNLDSQMTPSRNGTERRTSKAQYQAGTNPQREENLANITAARERRRRKVNKRDDKSYKKQTSKGKGVSKDVHEDVARSIRFYSRRRNRRQKSTEIDGEDENPEAGNEMENEDHHSDDLDLTTMMPGAVAVIGIDGDNPTSWNSDALSLQQESPRVSFQSTELQIDTLVEDETQNQNETASTLQINPHKRNPGKRVVFGMVAVAFVLIAAVIIIVAVLLSSDEDSSTQNREQMVLKILSDVSDTTLVKTDGSPQQLAFDWIVRKDNRAYTNLPDKLKSRYALAVFYYATGGNSSWISHDNWLDGDLSECKWEFLTCSGNEIVRIQTTNIDEITPSGNGLIGTLPLKELSVLTSLETLDLEYNSISGTIDPVISAFPKLRLLRLNDNTLSGTLPEELYSLTTLEILALADNDFEGTVSMSVGKLSRLVFLRLDSNRLTSTIPEALYDLTSLKGLWLSSNSLTGGIDASIGQLSNLGTFNIATNSLMGSIPSSIGMLTNLKYLLLRTNKLTGKIPSEITELGALVELNLGENRLTGVIPLELYSLGALERLALDKNDLSGSISSLIGNLSNLEFLNLAKNMLSSAIPTEIGLTTDLTVFQAATNQFSSSMPTEVGLLKQLAIFTFFNTEITGAIPQELCEVELLCCNDGIFDEFKCCSWQCTA